VSEDIAKIIKRVAILLDRCIEYVELKITEKDKYSSQKRGERDG